MAVQPCFLCGRTVFFFLGVPDRAGGPRPGGFEAMGVLRGEFERWFRFRACWCLPLVLCTVELAAAGGERVVLSRVGPVVNY